jgi:hypothetical protein
MSQCWWFVERVGSSIVSNSTSSAFTAAAVITNPAFTTAAINSELVDSFMVSDSAAAAFANADVISNAAFTTAAIERVGSSIVPNSTTAVFTAAAVQHGLCCCL